MFSDMELATAQLEKINETLEKIHEDLYHISVALNKLVDKESPSGVEE